MSTIAGKQFNEHYTNTRFYKLTNATEIHREHHFVTGLNVDAIPFNAEDEGGYALRN